MKSSNIQKHDISELRRLYKGKSEQLEEALRKCRILIIDDESEGNEDGTPYIFKSNIDYMRKQLRYNIVTVTDISSLDEVQGYDIIISDIAGVGEGIEKGINGIELVRRLSSRYPEKIYALFSSYAVPLREINPAADVVLIDKNDLVRARGVGKADIVLTEKVNTLMSFYASPTRRWEKIRLNLLKEGMSIHEVAELESAYVESVQKGDVSAFSQIGMNISFEGTDQQEDKVQTYIQTAASVINTILTIINTIQ